jgi:glycosyltransferase EpsD
MAKKLLLCATVDIHFKAFHLPYMQWFKEQGWEVHMAAAGQMELPYIDKRFDIPIQRSPLKLQNIHAYHQLKSIIDDNKYDVIHCHTPMGGVLARIAARNARKLGTKVMYTAHGFHFCKGAPLINWLVYYPIEKALSHFTDCLITINEEDHARALNRRFHAKRIEHVHGVGVNTERYKPLGDTQKRESRENFGYKRDEFLMFYAAEFNKNKNQQFLIGVLALLKEEIPQARLLLAGEGLLQENCRELAKQLGVADKIDFLGYRHDIDRILPMCDIAVSSSIREGLPVNIMEAMSCGLPVIASDNRGNRELVQNFGNGFVIDPDDKNGMSDKIIMLSQNKALKHTLGMSGREMIERKYAINKVLDEKKFIYSTFMDEKVEVVWAIQ